MPSSAGTVVDREGESPEQWQTVEKPGKCLKAKRSLDFILGTTRTLKGFVLKSDILWLIL